jgi:hypothetical protein
MMGSEQTSYRDSLPPLATGMASRSPAATYGKPEKKMALLIVFGAVIMLDEASRWWRPRPLARARANRTRTV